MIDTNNLNSNNNPNSLSRLGWTDYFQNYLDSQDKTPSLPARVVGVHKNSFLIHTGDEEKRVTAAGRLSHKKDLLFPVIGDWVMVKDNVISTVIPRKNALSRGAAGAHEKKGTPSTSAQTIAANLDHVFIVTGTDRDFNLRRIERYLTLIYNCGLNPVIVLTKSDLHTDPDSFVQAVEPVAFGVPVHLTSDKDPQSLADLETYISKGKTIAMIGSSGAGKSTLLNRLYGTAVQTTHQVSEKLGKGTHTTTARSLIVMPQGGMIIDNPGIREVGLWGDPDGIEGAFPEIEALAMDCRFNDCSHVHEPGCQVRTAIETGELKQERLDNFLKMKREMAYVADRAEKSADRIEKERWKGIAKKIKTINKHKR